MFLMKDIARTVAIMTRVPEDLLLGPRRLTHIVIARFIAFHYCRAMTGCTLPRIGMFFGKDHTTILNGIRRAAELKVEISEWPELEACFFRILVHVIMMRHEYEQANLEKYRMCVTPLDERSAARIEMATE